MQVPKKLITDLLEASLRFHEVVETLEVQLDKETLRRLKLGKKEYKQGEYKVASTRQLTGFHITRRLNITLLRNKGEGNESKR